MAPPKINIMHALRLQLKTGFIKSEPASYQFMKRFPPLNHNNREQIIKPSRKDIPYLHLYKKAIERNVLNQEFVYPAYWREEPKALIIAKKQYQHMMEGDDEETAYRKAEQYMDELENKAYLELKSLGDVLKDMGAQPPFMTDAELMSEIEAWKQKLQHVSYDQLELADQGEIDYILQTKILRWGEVERARRMKDPIFVMQFEALRELIFTEGEIVAREKQRAEREAVKRDYLQLHGIDPDKLGTTRPFYVEDYIFYFNKARKEPDLMKWQTRELDEFSAWVIDTLAQRCMVEDQPSYKVQTYLERVRANFFPMLRHPKKARSVSIPASAQDFKRLLYDNDIGYKSSGTEEGKLFVQRYYKLPALLFPTEMFAERLMADPEHVEKLLDDESTAELLKEMEEAGCDTGSVAEVKAQLQEYLDKYNLSMPAYSSTSGELYAMSTLDEILSSAYEDTAEAVEANASALGIESDVADDDVDDDEDDDDAGSSSSGESELHDYTEEEWAALVGKYKKPALTELEQERDRIFSLFEYNMLENATCEDDLQQYQNIRLENSVIAQARMEKVFNEKEAARKEREWRQRGVWTDEMPNPLLPIV